VIGRLALYEVENVGGDFVYCLDKFGLAGIAALDAVDEAFQVHMFISHFCFSSLVVLAGSMKDFRRCGRFPARLGMALGSSGISWMQDRGRGADMFAGWQQAVARIRLQSLCHCMRSPVSYPGGDARDLQGAPQNPKRLEPAVPGESTKGPEKRDCAWFLSGAPAPHNMKGL
jgi:hypothetical protein